MGQSSTFFGLSSRVKKGFIITGVLLAFFGAGILLVVHSLFHPAPALELFLIIILFSIFFFPLFYVPLVAGVRLERDAMTYSWILSHKIYYSDLYRFGYGVRKNQKFGIHLLAGEPPLPLRIEHSKGILEIPLSYFNDYKRIVANLQTISGMAAENPATF